MDQLFSAENIVSLLTMTFLEIVLGIDNIIFISIAANKLSPSDQPRDWMDHRWLTIEHPRLTRTN